MAKLNKCPIGFLFFFFLFFIILNSFLLIAIDPGKALTQYNIKIWDMEGGLPCNSVYAICQTRDGYLWIGTQDGLVRFDGFEFELYNRQRTPQLKSNEIHALFEDHSNTLWIGTSSGGLTKYKNGIFTLYSPAKHKSLIKISSINEDRWGKLWFGSRTRGLTFLKNDQFLTYTTHEGLPSNEVYTIQKDNKGDLWVTTSAGILKLIKPGTFKVYVSKNQLPVYKTVSLYDEDKKQFWIGTGENGLFSLKNSVLKSYKVTTEIPQPSINSIYMDRGKSLWIGIDGGGLCRLQDGELSTLTKKDGLTCGFIYSICEDQEGSLWVGTIDGGLHQLKDNIFTNYTSREGLPHDYVHCIHESLSSRLWIGTKKGLACIEKGRISNQFPGKAATKELAKKTVTALWEDRNDFLWIGTWRGLYKYKYLEGTLISPANMPKLSDNRIKCIYEDNQGRIWIGTWNGLNRYNPKNNTIARFYTRDGLSSNIIESISEDRSGNLWICTDPGLSLIKDGEEITRKKIAENGTIPFRCAYQDHSRTLWFGTDNGLIRLKNGNSTIYTESDGLIESFVSTILEDDKGYLWLSGRNGISRVSIKELSDFSEGKTSKIFPLSFNENDGMKSRSSTGRGYRTRDRLLWFPTGSGLCNIDPLHFKRNISPIPIKIKKILVDGQIIQIHQHKNNKALLELPPGKKRLEFAYTALSFINPNKIHFQTLLKGYDSDWVNMGNQRRNIYTELSPGKYTFMVRIRIANGTWEKVGASFSFYLKPFFYQTSWFYPALFLLGLGIIFMAHQMRIRHLRNREKELTKLVEMRTRNLAERTSELEHTQSVLQNSQKLIEAKNLQLETQSKKLKDMDKMKSHFFTNISHEFRTPLTLIMGHLDRFLEKMPSKEDLKKRARLMLRNSQRLLTLINQLLELSKFEDGKVTLKAQYQALLPFIKGMISIFEPVALQQELELTLDVTHHDKEIPLYFDTEKLEEVLSNLLSNSIKFTPPGGRIMVKINPAGEIPNNVSISIRDTGPGIPRDQLSHIFDRFFQAESTFEYHRKGSGIGLAIAKELVELHHGSIVAKSEKGEGTEFTLTLPLGKDHLNPDEILPQTHNPEPFTESPSRVNLSAIVQELEEKHEDTEQTNSKPDFFTSKPIVLVVEDHHDTRVFIKKSIEFSYRVILAKDGQEGIEKAKEFIPDLIISDVMMPEKNGVELCQEIKRNRTTSHIPVILLTAKASEESMMEGLMAKADDYITKPFNTKLLLAKIKNLIEVRSLLQKAIEEGLESPSPNLGHLDISSNDKEFLKDLVEIINEEIAEPEFNMDELCGKLYMSRSSLYRKIQALSGESPADFIRSFRLKRGAELLKNMQLSVLEVAFEVGFSSANYFTKCFKKKYNLLPTQYQRKTAPKH